MAEREIKTTLALDGEKAFKASMDEAYRGLKVLGSEMKLNTAIFGDNASSMEGLTKKGEILRKEIAQQKEIVAALSKAVEDAAASYGENDKRTDAYRVKLNNATAALTNMEGELKNNDKAVENWGKEAKDADKKTIDWTASLKKAGEVLGKTVLASAKATGVAVAAVGTAAAVAAKKVFDATVNAGKFADELVTTSNQTGISTDTLQKWGYAARFIDTEVDTMTGGMARMIRQLPQVMDGTGDTAEAFKTLGVSVKDDATGQLRDSEAIFMSTIDALGRISNETERDALSMQIFGKSAQELNPLIKAGSDELSRLGQEAEKAGLVLDQQAIGALGNFDDTMQRIDAQTQGLARSLAVNFLPAVSGVMTGVQEVLTGAGTALKDGFRPEDIQTIGSMISQKLIEGINTITQYLPSVIETVSGMLTQLVGVLVTILPTLLPPLMEGATQLLTGLMTALSANIEPIAAAATTIVTQFVSFLTANLPMLLTMGLQLILEFANGITNAIPQLIPAVVASITAIVKGLVGQLPQLVKTGIELVVALIKGLIDAIPKLIDAIPSIIEAIVTTVTTNLPVIVKAGIELLVAVIGGIIKAIPQLVAAMPQVIAGVVRGLIAGVGSILDVGRQLVEGLWNGIKNATTWLWNKIKGWIDDALGWIADLLGIHSPSSKMRDLIGKPMVQGIAQGIAKNAYLVNDAMSSLIPDTRSTALAMDVTRKFNDVAGSATGSQAKTNQSLIDYDRLAVAVANNIPAQKIEVTLDGKKVGYGTAKYVSEAQGNAVTSLRRSGFRADFSAGLA